MPVNTTIRWQAYAPRQARWAQLGQRPAIAWLTGLPGSGKTTISDAVDRRLATHGRHVCVLDGDNLRHGLCSDLGFSAADRAENVRRTAEVARLMAEAGLVVIVSLISPFRADRARARAIAGDLPFLEVYVDTSLATCEARDPKGLYARARGRGDHRLHRRVGPYELPEGPDLTLRTQGLTVAASAEPLCARLMELSASA